MGQVAGSEVYETPEDIGDSPQAIARRWKLELQLAHKREEAWRKKATEAYRQYAPDDPKTGSYNILWPNTETLRQALYNSLPQPQVRRRYSDEDPLGKSVSEVLERALEFSLDEYDFDGAMKGDVLCMLLAGRAVSRVRYVPSLRQVGGEDSPQDKGPDEAQESEALEEIDWEQVCCERIQWDDLRIGPGKHWNEIEWVAFRQRLPREELIERFGPAGERVTLDSVEDADVQRQADLAPLFKTAEVWEIWDREGKQVVWIAQSAQEPLLVQPDPLGLQGFYPIPRPLYAVERDQSLVPVTLYSQYEMQARELNKVSLRISRLTDALRVRGIYDATLSELSELMKASDNELVPAANAMVLLERGGLEKAIWMMPIQDAAQVLGALYQQRDQIKAVIYELTGIADIMRAASDPSETFGAQKIKTTWGTQRLQKLQREVQRYIRDLLRLKAEVVAEKFQPETLAQMTLVDLPTNSQVHAQYFQAIKAAHLQNQPAPPPPQGVVTWEAVISTLRNDAARTYHIDIETDSTLSASQDADMAGLRDVLTAVTQLVQGFGPAVSSGAIPVDAVKEIILAVVRRARMGSAVEDALDKIQPPQPPPDPNAGQLQMEQQKAQLQAQQAQQNAQIEMQVEQAKMQLASQLEQSKQQAQAAQLQHQNELEAAREQQRQQLEAAQAEHQAQLDVQKEQSRMEFERWKAELEAQTRIAVAEIGAQAKAQNAPAPAAPADMVVEDGASEPAETPLMEMHRATLGVMQALLEQMSRPKRIVRGPDGRALGVE